MNFSRFKVEPKKISSGAKSRNFFFLATFVAVAFFGIINYAKASTDMDSLNVVDMPANASDFGAWFHSQNLPLVKEGHEFWDYMVYPARGLPGDPGYYVSLFTADGVWMSGNAQSLMIADSASFTCGGTYCFGYHFDVDPNSQALINYNAGKNYYEYEIWGDRHVQLGTFYSNASGFVVGIPLFSSQDFSYVTTCEITTQAPNTWYLSQGTATGAYNRCGSWNPSCSPVTATFPACGIIEPPPPPPVATLTCAFDFASIPPWTDPLGMFKGFFSSLFGWLGCAFNGTFKNMHDSVVSVSMIIGDFFTSATNTVGGFVTSLATSISGFVTSAVTSVGGFITNAVSSVGEFFSGVTWGDIAMFVFLPNQFLMEATINTQADVLHEKFPNFFQFYSSFNSNVPANAGNVKIYEGDLVLRGQTAHLTFDPFHSLPIPEFVPLFLTAIMYLNLGWWLLRNLSNLFSE